jgi:hypothetical protein
VEEDEEVEEEEEEDTGNGSGAVGFAGGQPTGELQSGLSRGARAGAVVGARNEGRGDNGAGEEERAERRAPEVDQMTHAERQWKQLQVFSGMGFRVSGLGFR